MKKIVLMLSLFVPTVVYGQMSEGGLPFSYGERNLKSAVQIPAFKLEHLNVDSLKTLKTNGPSPCIYSKFQKVSIDVKKEGVETAVKNGSGNIWRYRIYSDSAKSIQLVFSKFVIPDGAKLFLYNSDYSTVYGAFTNKNMAEDSTFTIADFMGNTVIVEYYEPSNSEFSGIVHIGLIGQGFSSLLSTSSLDQSGYVGVNCPEGEAWQDQKHAVCMITFRYGIYGAECSGALLNNVRNDGTPFFLTAHHCISDSLTARSVVAYFNYEQKECNSSDQVSPKTLSGATLLTTGVQSDYTLLKLTNTPTAVYKPYYAGWDATGVTDASSVGIHHPNRLPKKISLSLKPDQSYNDTLDWIGGTPTNPGTHWYVHYDKGRIYEGSSGSPLFDENHRVIGQLHGGGGVDAYYGKLSYSWTHSNSGYKTLQSYLDPNNTGIKVIDGYYPSANSPDAKLNSEYTLVCPNAPVPFHGFSAFLPQTYQWSFYPNQVTYLDSTTSGDQSPVVSFNQPGQYDVRLLVTNKAGMDSVFFSNRITAGNKLGISVYPDINTDSCLIGFSGLKLDAQGATTFAWSLLNGSANYFHLDSVIGNSAKVVENTGIALDSTFTLKVQTKGTHGTCVDSVQTDYPLFAAKNDNIANAIPLALGLNGPFTNKCATVQSNEPVPPHTSCTGQLSWCDEYGTGRNIVENSVWFYFIGPSNGVISMSSEGMDNEIAVYAANSYQDILSGNYTLIAANDDRSNSDPNPLIDAVKVTPGKTYWVQVDGSGGGTEGNFTLKLENYNLAGIKNFTLNDAIKIYPQPATDHIIVKSNRFLGNTSVNCTVYSLTGELIYSNPNADMSGNELWINTQNWSKGMYILRLNFGGNTIYKKIIR